MTLVLLVAVSGAAAESPAVRGVESLSDWWTAPGGPAFVDDAAMGNGLPVSLLGLVAGGVGLRDALLPAWAPWPGVDEIRAPLAWVDSAAVVIGERAGWRGFSGSLAELRTFAPPPTSGKPRAQFTLVNGSSAIDRTGLLLQRGGATSWLRGGALTEERAGTGLLGRRGAHVWFLELGQRRGAHELSGSFSERGAAGGTRTDTRSVDLFGGSRPPYVGFAEAASGESGALSWKWARVERALTATLRRSHDHRESFEIPVQGVIPIFAEREAQQNSLELEASAGSGGRTHGVRAELTQALVTRSDDFLSGLAAHASRQRTVWLAARDERPLAGGRLELEAGVGYTTAGEPKPARVQAAPSAVWRLGEGSRRLRVYGERLVTPVWSDLAPGVTPFLQDAWVGGADVAVGDPQRHWLQVGALAAEVGRRALLQRFPVRDLSLRYGWTDDAVRVRDAMLTVAAGATRGGFACDASGFTRVRPRGTQGANVDAALGGRAGAEAGFRAFADDLGVRLRLEGAWVGARETASLPEYFTRPTPLPGYATFGGSLALELGDARIVLRATNLEDRPHSQVWTDPSSPFPGTPAVGSGRQFMAQLSWPLFN